MTGLRLVFLGQLEDLAGAAARTVPLAFGLEAVIDALEPELAEVLRGPRVKLAINGVIVRGAPPTLRDGDEVAFLPPVSGG